MHSAFTASLALYFYPTNAAHIFRLSDNDKLSFAQYRDKEYNCPVMKDNHIHKQKHMFSLTHCHVGIFIKFSIDKINFVVYGIESVDYIFGFCLDCIGFLMRPPLQIIIP